jgi:hypothetical protein
MQLAAIDIITEFRGKNPRTSIPETAFPEPYLLTETENKIIDGILELLNKHGLTAHQSQNLLERLEQQARDAKRRLWADPAPIPPWVYRKVRRA